MRYLAAILLSGVVVSSGLAASITTQHFSSIAEVNDYVINDPDFEFYARGDTEMTSMTAPPDGYDEAPLTDGLWINGDPHSFRVAYDVDTNRAGISLDNEYTSELPIDIHPDTNGLLITAFTDVPGATVRVHNMRIILKVGEALQYYPPLGDPPIADQALAPDTDFLIIETDLALTDYTFVLAGQVTFSWPGGADDIPAGANQWFEVSPIVTPEPTGGVLALMGSVVFLRRRRA